MWNILGLHFHLQGLFFFPQWHFGLWCWKRLREAKIIILSRISWLNCESIYTHFQMLRVAITTSDKNAGMGWFICLAMAKTTFFNIHLCPHLTQIIISRSYQRVFFKCNKPKIETFYPHKMMTLINIRVVFVVIFLEILLVLCNFTCHSAGSK